MRLAFDRSIAVRLWRAATLLLAGVLCSSAASAQTAVTFTSNGTYTVPPMGVRLLRIQVNGGGGGGGACGAGGAGGSGGNGGSVSGSVAVTPGQTFFVQVGQGGAPGVARGALGVVGAGGMGGMSPLAGGQGGSGFLLGGGGGGGGGATVVSTMMGTSTVILVAGGGGGGTGGGGAVGPAGGAGGMLNGGPGAATGGMSPLAIDGGGGGGGGGGTPGGAGGSANTGGAGASASVGGSSLIHTGLVTMGAAMVGLGGSGGAGLRAGCSPLMLGQPGSPGSVTITEFECSGPDQCLDTNPCTQDSCVGNTCFHRPLNTDEMCIGAAGFCLNNGLTSQCVGCTSNSQCSGSAPACDTTTHNCRPCAVATQGTDCQTGQLCNGASGSCGGCSLTVQTPMNMGTASGTPIFSGRSTPGQTVTVTVDGMAVGFAVVDASGNWSLPWPSGGTPLSNGTHSYSVVGCGGTSTSAGVFTVNSGCGSNAECPASTPICDLTRRACRPCNPATQATDCGSLVCNTSTGACASLAVAIVSPPSGSNTTNRPTITGTATPGQMVTVTVDGMVVGTVTADASGMWFLPWPSTTPSLGLGTHHLVANAGSLPGATASATGTFFVPCASNTECSGGTPICDRSTGSCRACTPSGMSSAECDSRTPFCSSTGSTAGQCVLLPPSIVMPAAGSSTSSGRPPITGTGPANSMIVVLLDGMRAGTVTTDAAGNWVFVPPTALAPGMHRVSAANVSAGVTGPEGTPHGFTITPCALSTDCAGLTPVCDATSRTCRACAVDADCASPRPRCANTGALAGMCVAVVPTVTTPADGASTGSRRPTIRGVAPPGSIVSVLLDGVDVGRATADANGDFTFTPTMDLSLGMHTVAGHVAQDGGTFGPTGNMVRFTVTSCATRAECSGGTPVCDSTSHNCRACNPATEATDCPDPQRPVCATTGTQQGQCVVQRPLVTTPAEGSRSTNTHPTFSGTGTPGSTVVVLVDGAEVGRTMVDASGRWTLTPGGSTSAGAHTVAASNVAPDGAQGLPGNMVHFTVLECDANAPCAAGLRCDELAGRCVPVGQDAGPGDGSDASSADAGEDAALEATAGDGSALDASAPTGGGRSFASGACACEAPGRVGGTSRAGLALALCALGLAAARRRRVL